LGDLVLYDLIIRKYETNSPKKMPRKIMADIILIFTGTCCMIIQK